jgi:hypothetical protein
MFCLTLGSDMILALKKLLLLGWWCAFASRMLENWRQRRLDDELDAAWATQGPVVVDGESTVVADGMWHNPNHFLRLRLFIEALSQQGAEFRLLGVLRTRADKRERRALERIGFHEFIYIDEDEELTTDGFLAEAEHLLSQVASHADMLDIRLPHGLPAYVVYDTVLKNARDPQPPINHPLWRKTLAQTLRNLAIYTREFERRKVTHVALSHAWKSEFGALIWLAISRQIPSYHLTGFVEGMRIRRFRSHEDYRNPVEHLPVATFDALPESVRDELAHIGAAGLERRIEGGVTSDINARYAFRPEIRIDKRTRARAALVGTDKRPIVVVYAHVWFDFPHVFDMSHFTDFRDWMELTLAHVCSNKDVMWLIKPHPTEEWYGGFRLADLVCKLPPHVNLLPLYTDSKTMLTAADCVVTVHGTVSLEAAALGLPVILADRSYFSNWGFGHVARDRADYLRLLSMAGRLATPSLVERDRARAAFALALTEPPEETGALHMSCDGFGSALYREIIGHVRSRTGALAKESQRLSRFLDQDEIDSFATFHLVELARRRVGAISKYYKPPPSA